MESIVLGKVALPTFVHKAVRGELSQPLSYQHHDSPIPCLPHPGAVIHSHTLCPQSASENEGELRAAFVGSPCHATIVCTAKSF